MIRYKIQSTFSVFPKPNSIHYFDENIEYEELLKITVLEEPTMENITYKLDTTFKKVNQIENDHLKITWYSDMRNV